ncbi:MAG: hypothetical protein Q7P63_17585 [Verrucomicrobiota bacterium JB022]|nr:hypothetical protein [Verrucomicrobiota bacterium JB022]
MDALFISLYEQVGHFGFLCIVIAISLFLCFAAIPFTTDWMVDSAAGLAGKYWGANQRTLVINASTNNPELFSMLTAFALLQLGGIANPLGSNFANIYLMYLIAPLFVMLRWVLTGKGSRVKALIQLAGREKRLVAWHAGVSIMLFLFSSFAYWCLTGTDQFNLLPPSEGYRGAPWLLLAAGVCGIGIGIFMVLERGLKRKRPELFDEINSERHDPSWLKFTLGTVGLVASTFLMNGVFLAVSQIYHAALVGIFGSAIFAGIHYFVASILTSLPETKVATDNLQHGTSADLNTALAACSYSSGVNLALGVLGCLIAGIMLLLGVQYSV